MKTEQFTYKGGQIIIGIIEEDIETLINLLENFELYQPEYSFIRTEKRRKEFLAARILLNKVADNNVLVVYDENNKPLLSDKAYHISITHSKNFVAVMLHPEYPVGIDLEIRTNRVQNIYKRFLNTAEQKNFYNENDTSKLEIAWSAKETLFKIIGKDVQDFAAELEIFSFPLNDSGTLNVLYLSGSRIYELYYLQNETYTLVFGVDKRIRL
jgi:4'-phosphopantetheinyl transferase